MNEIPQKIGKYDVISVVGRGAMGVVYRGHDPYVDRPVAIKLASQVAMDDDGMARRLFINEARSAGRLDHANVLKVYEAGEEDGRPYMVMEYIEGGDTLRNHCSREKLLPVDQVLTIIRQTADAVDYAHTLGVLHRDIKPANIMLTRAGTAKLGDFGIARRMGADQTQIVGWFGSPLYMSPEQARDSEITPQSDLFSLGSVLYEMLAGVPPFAAKGLTGLIQKVCYEDPPPIAGVAEGIWRIIKKLLEKDLRNRYQTGAEVVHDIDALSSGSHGLDVTLTESQKLEALTSLAFFREFTGNELKEVLKVASWRRCAAGEVVFAEGSKGRAFFVVAEGGLGVIVNGVRIADLREGDCFGELEYLSESSRSAKIVADSDCTLIGIERDFKEWASLPCQLRMSKTFQRVLIERLRVTTRELARALR